MDKKFAAADMPATCSIGTFRRDPAGGFEKTCWLVCAKSRTFVQRKETCEKNPPPFQQHGKIPLCNKGATSPPHEAKFQDAISQFCDDSKFKPGMNAWVDCRYALFITPPLFVKWGKQSTLCAWSPLCRDGIGTA